MIKAAAMPWKAWAKSLAHTNSTRGGKACAPVFIIQGNTIHDLSFNEMSVQLNYMKKSKQLLRELDQRGQAVFLGYLRTFLIRHSRQGEGGQAEALTLPPTQKVDVRLALTSLEQRLYGFARCMDAGDKYDCQLMNRKAAETCRRIDNATKEQQRMCNRYGYERALSRLPMIDALQDFQDAQTVPDGKLERLLTDIDALDAADTPIIIMTHQ